jgi:hypothetical protein
LDPRFPITDSFIDATVCTPGSHIDEDIMPLHLTDKADFGLIYDTESARYGSAKTFPCTREQYIALGADLPSIGFAKDGVHFGGAFFFQHEMHATFLPEFHGRWGQLIRPMWDWMLAIEDPVRLRIEKDNIKCQTFLDRQHWPRDGEDDEHVYFMISSAGMPRALLRRDERLANAARLPAPSAAAASAAANQSAPA